MKSPSFLHRVKVALIGPILAVAPATASQADICDILVELNGFNYISYLVLPVIPATSCRVIGGADDDFVEFLKEENSERAGKGLAEWALRGGSFVDGTPVALSRPSEIGVDLSFPAYNGIIFDFSISSAFEGAEGSGVAVIVHSEQGLAFFEFINLDGTHSGYISDYGLFAGTGRITDLWDFEVFGISVVFAK